LLAFGAESLVFQLAVKNINIHRNTLLPFVLCGSETWSLTVREEGRLRVSENRVLRMIF